MPSDSWEIIPSSGCKKVEVWSNEKVLKYVAAMLFVNSVCSEGPRYIQILGSCLADKTVNDSLEDLLPPPFGSES